MRKSLALIFAGAVFPVVSFAGVFGEFRGFGEGLSAGSGVAFVNTISSSFYNPAGLAELGGLSAQVGYSFSSSENDIAFTAGSPVGVGGIGVIFRSDSPEGFSFTSIGLGYGFNLFRLVSIGFTAKYLTYKQDTPAFEDTGFSIDLGVIGMPARNVRLGFAAFNLNKPKFGESVNSDRWITAGVSYEAVKNVFVMAATSVKENDNPDIRIGVKYAPFPFLVVRSGYRSNPGVFSLGVGTKYSKFSLEAGVNVYGDKTVLLSSLRFELRPSNIKVFAPPKPRVRRSRRRKGPKIKKPQWHGKPININTAGVEELMMLPRIGYKAALRIIEYRKKHGPFKKPEDITKVPRIGKKTYLKFKHMITVGEISGAGEEKPKASLPSDRFDINHASLKDLVDLGLSPVAAYNIVKKVKEEGGFTTWQDITELMILSKKDLKILAEAIYGQNIPDDVKKTYEEVKEKKSGEKKPVEEEEE